MDGAKDAISNSSSDLAPSPASAISDLHRLDPDTDLDDLLDTSIECEDRHSELDGNDLEAIAICGFSIKFPQDADSADSFWLMMCEKRCATTEFPKDRLDIDGFHDDKHANNTVSPCHSHDVRSPHDNTTSS